MLNRGGTPLSLHQGDRGAPRQRFVGHRLDGIYDEPRVGAPRTISDDAVEAVIVQTLESTPPGETHWSTRTMAKAGISHWTVGRIWRTSRLKRHVPRIVQDLA